MRQAFAAWVEFCMGPSLFIVLGFIANAFEPGTNNLVMAANAVCNYS
jgi:hypothetical protein